MEQARVTLANRPDPDKIMQALIECYQAGIERKTGKRYKATIERNTREEERDPARKLRA